ncbi:tetratricopeptide repeat protein [Nostoc sp. 'Peltigera membranacea cyanobiont' 232]|uniref:tetratricopeptide repeat protein n=1 Tax=Nostoc sp. 'Peltigera membranacea cyanobiont' 232 TaxID=2014531 RepID=UPI000B953E57|nr:tetratricopeptide repeat protein [Nostoc sp. 'Peltigera membranacea cyanobiont' 232]OYE03091.1 hypothetical protein CDG79_20435 [Nostoc sp. 'Peltigera membranacea cyanobiont' 232]
MSKLSSIDDFEGFLIQTNKPYLISSKDIFINQEQEEEYQILLRSLTWTDGFGLFFIECITEQAERLIHRLKLDLPKKYIDILKFTEPVDNLYNIVNGLPNRDEINILCIKGLEYSLNKYIKSGFGGEGDYYKEDSVPRILAHLNLQRERFRDSFNICFLFLLPKFAVKYFIRRAPDFYDWRSGTFEFSTDKDILEEILRVIDKDIKQYLNNFTIEQCQENILKIDSIIEDYQDLHKKADLFLKKGLLLFKVARYKDAIDCFDLVLEINAQLSHVWNYRGIALLVSERIEESIICFDKVLELEPNKYEIYLFRGLGLFSLDRLEDAIINFDKYLEFKSDDYIFWEFRARVLANLERYQDALASLDKALEFKSDDYNFWEFRARVLANLKRYQDALASLDKALELKSDDYEIWKLRVIFFINLKRYQDALASLDKALELKSNDYEIWQFRATALANLERYQDALASLDKALELKSDNYEVWQLRAPVLAKLKRYQDALASLDKALELKSDDYEIWKFRVIFFIHFNSYQDALTSLDKALELKSDDYELWDHKTIALYKLKYYDEAIKSTKKSISLYPENSKSWNALGYLLLRKYSHEEPELNTPLAIYYEGFNFHGKQQSNSEESEYYQESLTYFDQALKFKKINDDDCLLYWTNRSYSLYYLGRYQEALASCTQSVKLKLRKDVVWANKGFILLKLGRYREAIESFKKVFKINFYYRDIHYSLASCYALKNNIKQAVKTLKEAILINYEYRERAKLDPNFDQIRQDRRFQKLMQAESNK